MPAPPHQSRPGPTASTIPCWGGGSWVPGGTTRPEARTRSGSSSLMTTWSKSGRSWFLIHLQRYSVARRSVRARLLPYVDSGVHGVSIYLGELVLGEVELIERAQAVLELAHAAGPDQGGRDAPVAQDPGDRHLGERLAAPLRDLVEPPDPSEVLVVEEGLLEEAVLSRARVLRDAVQVSVGEHPLAERREHDAAHLLPAEHLEQLRLDPAVEQRVRGLVDEQRRSHLAQDPYGVLGARAGVRRDARVERLALAHGRVDRSKRLLERRVGIEAVRVEDVDVVEPHPLQALVEAREQVFARAPFTVEARPHVVAGLRGDDQLVSVGQEVLAQDAAEVDLGGAGGRAVVVGEGEMADAEGERPPQDRALRLDRPVVAEVVPEPERDLRELEAAGAAAAILHVVVSVFGSVV